MIDHQAIWNALTTPIYRLLNADGENGDRAQIRPLREGYWLYRDEQDGYSVLKEADVAGLMMESEG